MFDQIRHSLRSLLARPGFTVFATLALGLGIGANCALFTVLDSLLFRPLPYARPDEIVEVSGALTSAAVEELSKADSFAGVTTFIPRNFPVRGERGGVQRVYGVRATANLFRVLGVDALIGRTLAPEDATLPVVVLGYDYWRRISGKPEMIGQTIDIAEDTRRTVIGVLPADFTLQVRDANLFVPVGSMEGGRTLARLASGVSPRQAGQQAAAIVHAVDERSADTIRVIPIAQAFRPGAAGTVWLFQAAVGLVLLITCANLANLLLVHGAARHREFAIRAALGAGRARLFGQLMTENLIVALGGGAVGLVLTAWSLDWIGSSLPANVSRMLRGADGLSIDGRVVAFTFGLSVLTMALFGLAPAARALRFDLMSSLRSGSYAASTGRGRLGSLLVAAEVGIALMLLIGSGLMLKNLLDLYNRDLGFDGRGVLRTAIELPRSRYPTPERRMQAFGQFLERVGALGGVESAAIVGPQLFPFGGPRIGGAVFGIEGLPDAEPRAEFYYATPDYLGTLRIPLLKGRWFTARDTAGSMPVAVVSDVVAWRYWPGGDALGGQIRLNPREPSSATIVGIVGNVRNPVGVDFTPVIYRPLGQTEASGGTIMIRTASGTDVLALGPTVFRQILAADPNAVEFRAAELTAVVADYVSPQRFATSLFGIFSGFGLLLAAVGIFAVTRHWVSLRIPEIGIRMALGAGRFEVLRFVLARAVASAAVGVVFGIGGAIALQRVIGSQLHGIDRLDPAVFAAVAALVALVSIASALLPAIRASRVEPVIALRQE